ncbi:hypothetical protein MSPP1_003986 [Malassezia sp. CBS 17886]|nr:hypothetical protein MSPP1_003986 [Malassezia sp. CBS 17886]
MGDDGVFRSATMSLIQLYIPTESVHATVTELGELGDIEFKDLNPDTAPFQRTFVSEIRRLDEMERRVRFLQAQLAREEIAERPLESALPLLGGADEAVSGPSRIEALSKTLQGVEERVAQMNGSFDALQKRLQELEEAKYVIRETAVFFQQAEAQPEHVGVAVDDDAAAPLLDGTHGAGARAMGTARPAFDLEFVAGTIERAHMATLERVLWRALRGNLFMNYAEIQQEFCDPAREGPVFKNVFVVFAHGASVLAKIRKICESMGGTLFPVESDEEARDAHLHEVLERIEDHENILYSTGAARRAELVRVAESLAAWADVVRIEKLVYATMNKFQYDMRQKTMVAEGWAPSAELGRVQLALRRATESTGAHVSSILQTMRTKETPPTYMRVNKFTEGFQAIIDAYGFATYKEANPGLFAVVTFPFLFAVMFGDVGHGLILLAAAGAMVLWERPMARARLDEITQMFFYGRYIILLMGAFAVFTGIMYNDIFSLSMHTFHSGWTWARGAGTLTAQPTGRVYPIGIDPSWHGAENNLVFTNSLKMKLSVIMGVAHMTFALMLNVPNNLYFKRPAWIWAELLPQVLFLESLFGYLVVAIVYKWSVDWFATDAAGQPLHNSPPGLLNMLIYMFLKPGAVDRANQLFPGQATLQTFLLLLAVACVPWMLIAKPYLLYKEHAQRQGSGYHAVGSSHGEQRVTALHDDERAVLDEMDDVDGDAGDDAGAPREEPFEIGEVVIHQIIHTIEFCLGCISNTASYLRLWALSLAHAQLSQVLWDMTIKNVFGMTGVLGVVATVIAFAVWFVLTICILCVMEGLSAFLHALRLEWVEAGSKHYEAGGYPFQPLAFHADGSGKGTLSARIEKHFGVHFISAGDLLRWNMANDTDVGREAAVVIREGRLMPDATMMSLVGRKLENMGDQDWILDGFPRTDGQARMLTAELANKKCPLSLVVNLQVPEEVILQRILGAPRWVLSLHAVLTRSNQSFNPPQRAGLDDITGEPLSKRDDDNPGTFKLRIASFHSQTEPMINHFRAQACPTDASRPLLVDLAGETSNVIWPKLHRTILERFPYFAT